MKVLLLSPLPPPAGGIASWTVEYLQYMKDVGHRVDIVDTAVSGKRKNNYSKTYLSSEITRTLRILKDLIKRMVLNKYDVVHYNTSCSRFGMHRDELLLRIIGAFNKNIVLQCHCNVNEALKSRQASNAFKRSLKYIKKCLVLNTPSKIFIENTFGVKVDIIANFLPSMYEDIAEEKFVCNDKIAKVLFVGHVQKAKGCDNIIEIASCFPDIQFRFVGSVFEEISNMEKTPNTYFTGELTQSEVLEEYNNADVLMFPTHTEGFPIAILEAMAVGLPIIATAVGSIPDMLEGKGGIFIPINNSKALFSALIEVADKSRRECMSKFNKDKVKSQYLKHIVIEKIVSIYRNI